MISLFSFNRLFLSSNFIGMLHELVIYLLVSMFVLKDFVQGRFAAEIRARRCVFL